MDLLKVYRKFFIANLHDEFSTLLFLVVGEVSRVQNVTYYFSSNDF